MTLDLLRVGGEQLRIGAWRGDARVAYIAPLAETRGPTAEAVRQCAAALVGRGYTEAVTAAVPPAEAAGFRAVGFTVREHLHLLAHDLLALPTVSAPPDTRLRRAHRADRPAVLAVDGLAFPGFWRLDSEGLDEALAATPSTRFRVAVTDGRVTGYAVTGRSGHRGFIQRLAVAPTHQNRGIGALLTADGLRWLRRRNADRVMVNTQERNQTALSLYERLGFRRQPGGLVVLHADLT
ncbi:MAG: GNAT family N-acetyltransferase [Acidimicrobiales bacterium]